MKPLVTEELQARFKEVGSQESSKDPIIIAKLFNPVGAATWYLTEYDPQNQIAFGYVTGLAHDEWGYVWIPELEDIQLPMGMTIERDIYFSEEVFSKVISENG